MKKPLITLGLSGAIGYYFYNKLAKAGFAPSYHKTQDVKMPENQSLINDGYDVNNNHIPNTYVEEAPVDMSYVNNEQTMEGGFDDDDMESTILTVEDEEQQPEENTSECNNVEDEYADVSVAPPLIHTNTEPVSNDNENNVDAVDDENEFADVLNENSADDLFANLQNTANENMPDQTMDEMPDLFANNSHDVVSESNDTSSAYVDADNNYVQNSDTDPNTMANSTSMLNQSDVDNAMLTDDELNALVNENDLFGNNDATSEFENTNSYTNAEPDDLFDAPTFKAESAQPQATPPVLNQNANQMEEDDDLFDDSSDDSSGTVNNNNETVMNVSESLHKCDKDDHDAQKEYNSIVDFFNQF